MFCHLFSFNSFVAMDEKVIVPKYLLDIVCDEYNDFHQLTKRKYENDLKMASTREERGYIESHFFEFLSWITHTVKKAKEQDLYPIIHSASSDSEWTLSSIDDDSIRSSITSGFSQTFSSSSDSPIGPIIDTLPLRHSK